MSKLPSVSRPSVCAAALIIATFLYGCSEQKWDWFGLKKSESKETKPAAMAKPAQPEKTAAKPESADPDDPNAKEVDKRVEEYVKSMNNRYDPGYVQNDFTTKIERQSDPDRANRIRKTAARSRSDSGQYEPEWAPDSGKNPGSLAGTDTLSKTGNDDAPQIADLKDPSTETADKKSAIGATPEKKSSGQMPATANRNQPKPLEPDAIEHKDSAQEPVTQSPAVATNRPPASVDQPEESTPAQQPETAETASANEKPVAKPPVLADISVSAAPKTTANSRPQTISDDSTAEEVIPAKTEPVATNSPVAPAPSTAAPIADAIKAKIAEQERLVARDPNNLEEQFRLRMMYLVDGQDDKALAPTDGVNEDIQEIMRGQIQAMMSARSTSERDPATWANRQLDAIETLRQLVRQKADLRVPKVELCSAIDGFGRYEPISPPDFRVSARNLVLLYIEVDNFQSEKTPSGMYRTLLSVRQSLLSTTGEELWTQRDENIEDLARQQRSDFYLTIGPLAIPKTLGAGEYVMKVEVEDVIAGKMNSNVARFKMVP
ncbi:MAG: hypothetical protein HS101_16480 [Planctomycetia bacterium]|nr:hypothetical protein [Planctomycetia bacterium]MCC7315812.1 hypothetical protein [Planctomycetota bacterium]